MSSSCAHQGVNVNISVGEVVYRKMVNAREFQTYSIGREGRGRISNPFKRRFILGSAVRPFRNTTLAVMLSWSAMAAPQSCKKRNWDGGLTEQARVQHSGRLIPQGGHLIRSDHGEHQAVKEAHIG